MNINKLLPLPAEINNIILYKYKGLSHPCSIIINNTYKELKDIIIGDLKRDKLIWGDTYSNIPDKILWEDIINNKYTDDDIGSFLDLYYINIEEIDNLVGKSIRHFYIKPRPLY